LAKNKYKGLFDKFKTKRVENNEIVPLGDSQAKYVVAF
jgi:hypothetical protein